MKKEKRERWRGKKKELPVLGAMITHHSALAKEAINELRK
jgi:hypothetical protein